MSELKTRVRVYETRRCAGFWFIEWTRGNSSEYVRADGRRRMVELRNGDELWFVAKDEFAIWSTGRRFEIEYTEVTGTHDLDS